MASGVFVLKDNDTLVSMEPARFASEDDFQKLLAKFPELLSGDQINPSSPRKWILVRREKAVPSEENGGGRWSLAILFLTRMAFQLWSRSATDRYPTSARSRWPNA